jgi:TatD DNase family protein
MTGFVDTHAHLGDPAFDADRDAVYARAEAAGVSRVVEIADHPDEWGRALSLARARPERVRCSLGLHPYYADRFDASFLERLKSALAANAPAACAIGEIGLDYARSPVAPEVQRPAFAALLAAGRDWGVPLVVHCRDAYADLVPMLRDAFAGPPKGRRFWGVVHCFTGAPEEARACAALGFALGADGPVTYKKNDALREGFRLAGPGATVLETDSPYLPPQSCRGSRNEPKAIPEIAARLAEIWGVPLEEAAARTSANARDLFGWP